MQIKQLIDCSLRFSDDIIVDDGEVYHQPFLQELSKNLKLFEK